MNILIVEDEPVSARRLRAMVADLEPGAMIAGPTDSVADTVAWLRAHPMPDLLLMDIELTDGKSFEVFDQHPVEVPVIFITAYDEYAIRAFKVNSIDYLLKPVKEEELRQALIKFRHWRQSAASAFDATRMRALLDELQGSTRYKDRYLVKQGDRLIPVPVADIAWFRTKDKANHLCTMDGKEYVIDQPLDDIERTLDPHTFFRANRQYIVSAGAVRKIHFWFSSKLKVDLQPDPGEEVIVSREKAMGFREWMGE